jgi:hypothetical protein
LQLEKEIAALKQELEAERQQSAAKDIALAEAYAMYVVRDGHFATILFSLLNLLTCCHSIDNQDNEIEVLSNAFVEVLELLRLCQSDYEALLAQRAEWMPTTRDALKRLADVVKSMMDNNEWGYSICSVVEACHAAGVPGEFDSITSLLTPQQKKNIMIELETGGSPSTISRRLATVFVIRLELLSDKIMLLRDKIDALGGTSIILIGFLYHLVVVYAY